MQLCSQTGQTPEELGLSFPEEPRCPEGCEYLWNWFCELSRHRGSNGFGASPLRWQDIAAWARLMGTAPEPWELAALSAMDEAACEALSDLSEKEK